MYLCVFTLPRLRLMVSLPASASACIFPSLPVSLFLRLFPFWCSSESALALFGVCACTRCASLFLLCFRLLSSLHVLTLSTSSFFSGLPCFRCCVSVFASLSGFSMRLPRLCFHPCLSFAVFVCLGDSVFVPNLVSVYLFFHHLTNQQHSAVRKSN